MNQDVIWNHFQNEGVDSFNDAGPRIEFLVRQISVGERALNIGLGSAALETLAVAKGVEIWCLDPNERTITRVRELLKIGDRARTGYSQSIPFPDEHFDVVVMSEVLEHLEPGTLERTLDEVSRVLRPGGRFIGTVPARENLSQSIVVCPSCAHKFHRWGHQSSFDEGAICTLLKTRFRDVRISEHFFIPWQNAGLVRRAGGLLKKFLSWRGIGTYGVNRNFAFVALKQSAARDEVHPH